MQIQLSSDQKAWAPKFKILKTPLQFQKGYLDNFETNLIDFCDFRCVRWKTTKSVGALETMGQCQKIYEYLSTILPSLHFMLQLECLSHIVCHNFEVYKLFNSKGIN
jgi:hypothetical protein